tara:strand:- start:1601 stop:1918 length:318 start_codon:yes stop_codon:yes gene_type:complete
LHSPDPGSECVATTRGVLEYSSQFTFVEIDLELIFKGHVKKKWDEAIIGWMALLDGHEVLDGGFARQVLELDPELSGGTSRYTFECCWINYQAHVPPICRIRQGR